MDKLSLHDIDEMNLQTAVELGMIESFEYWGEVVDGHIKRQLRIYTLDGEMIVKEES